MAIQQRHRFKRNYFFASLILITGFGGLLGYDLYFKPYVLSQTVVKIKVEGGEYLPKNYELKASDLYLDSVQTKDVPSGVITEIAEVEHKITNVNLTHGSILTASLVDVSDLEPLEDEGIFPIPKEVIYAINGSLRSRDKVDIYLVEGDREKRNATLGATAPLGGEELPEQSPINEPEKEIFLAGVTVNYVRTEDNNDVQDSEKGNNNNRFTSTGKVATPELKLKKSDGQRLGQFLEQGKKLWIVRVE